MSIVDFHAIPSRSMRRWFGLSLGLLLVIMSFPLAHFGGMAQAGLLAASIVLTVVYYGWPAAQLSIIRGWQVVTFPIAWLTGHALLSIVFFLVLTPIGLLLRFFRHDPLRLQKRDRSTAWQDHHQEEKPDRYFKQF
ncbi:SxtJ family membrane protein [Novipirellula artificiosorum]|uniref:SxtJ n=1 Tax=Novipirellula artificiosorum TaxID=2528016 RepID=A0A5C6DNP9_9BACT|nr:SxtJ family membrane protein [Novipirellula artificiosorum]TWU38470.1 hypothetical protein Poly41_29460 [Novipirellula artificiosorum]